MNMTPPGSNMMTTNPFYVRQGPGMAPGLQGLADVVRLENEKKEAEAKQKEMQTELIAAYNSGDPDQIATASLKYPGMAEQLKLLSGHKDELTKNDYKNTLFDAYLEPSAENLQKMLDAYQNTFSSKPLASKNNAKFISKYGEQPEKLKKRLAEELASRFPKAWKDFREATEVEGEKDTSTSDIKNFAKYEELLKTDAEKAERFGHQIGLFEKTHDTTPVATDMDDFVADAKKAYNLAHNGEEMPPDEVNAARLQYKRAQAPEAGAVASAKKQAEFSFSEKISNAAETGKMLAQIANTPELLKAKGEITPVQSKEDAANRITGVLTEVAGIYLQLDSKDAVVNTDKAVVKNVNARLGASGVGQFLANAVGTESQSLRNQIKNAQPLLINFIRQASEMGARGLDSEKELQFYLQAASDPTRDYKSNLAALAILDDAYGLGQISSVVKNTVPETILNALKQQGQSMSATDKVKYQEGQTATGPDGAKMVYRNGKWENM